MLKRKALWLLSVMAVAGLPRVAGAQAGSIGPSTAPSDCRTGLEISSVKFLGKSDKKDRFEVEWTVSLPKSSCVRISSYELKLSITRKRGHVDGGAVKGIAGSARKAIVEVPREALETAAVSYRASLTARLDGSGQKVLQLKGNGPPVLAPGGAAPSAPAEACNPSLKFEKVNFFANSGGKDVIGVFWNAESPSPCLTFKSVTATVRITRVDGRVESKSVPANLGSSGQTANVEFPAGAAIDRHEVTLNAETRLVSSVQREDTQKSGSFPD